MDKATKHREDQLRRMARRRGYRLTKNRVRDPLALDYGKYILTDRAGVAFELSSLDQVAAYLPKVQRR